METKTAKMETAETTNEESHGSIKVEKSILRRAIENEPEALSVMFRQFIPPNEEIQFAEYLGIEGFWGIGKRSFACVTDKRIASLQVGAFKEVIYQDGYLEYTNSGMIHQPSKLKMYVFFVIATFVSLWLALLAYTMFYSLLNPNRMPDYTLLPAAIGIVYFLILLPLTLIIAVKLFYRSVKCGLVWIIREGIIIYIFANRSKLKRANHLYRICTELRDERIRNIREPL